MSKSAFQVAVLIDVAWLASKHIVDKIVLVAGDTDFVPAMKFARREGVQVIIATVSPDVSSLLRTHSDEHRIIRVDQAGS